MRPCLDPHHALRSAWSNLSSFSTLVTLNKFTTPSPLRSRLLSHTFTAPLTARSYHISAHLCRQRRWRDDDDDAATHNKRDTRETDDDYIHYTARIQPLHSTSTATTPLFSPAITAASTVVTPTSSSTSPHVVHLTATPESTDPPPSSAAYRAALFAARDERRAEAALLQSVHSSGPSRRVRRWQSNQKRLRTRADRRRRKYHMNQSYSREQEVKDGVKYPHLLDQS